MEDKVLSRLTYLGDCRYQESHGLNYQDFTIGDIYEHRPGRTITETDNIWQSLINHNTHPLHSDHVYAEQTEFGQPLVSSLITFSIVSGLSLSGTSAKGIVNLGWKTINLRHPVFVGDTLFAESEVLNKRLSQSKPGMGIVTVATRGFNQEQILVLECQRSFMIAVD